jgi:hypothetical protein
MCAEKGSGLHLQCTAPTGLTNLRGTFLQLPVENRHVVYTIQAEVLVLRIAKEIHKQSFHDCTDGKTRHRASEQLQQSAFMLWFWYWNGLSVGLVVPVKDTEVPLVSKRMLTSFSGESQMPQS